MDIREDAEVLKFHKHPLDVQKYLEDLHNPKYKFFDDKNVLPEVPQRYIVSEAREYFNRFGYRMRICKVVGMTDGLDGWIPDKSLSVVFEGSEEGSE